VSVLVFLFMRQVMPLASGLASGVALNTMGTVSRAANWGIRNGREAIRLGNRLTGAIFAR
jgi:hypothetical protein